MGDRIRIRSYVEDRWQEGSDEGAKLLNPATEEVLATASIRGVDLGAALAHRPCRRHPTGCRPAAFIPTWSLPAQRVRIVSSNDCGCA